MLLAVHYRVMEYVGSLESTQEAIASGNSYTFLVLSKRRACSIYRLETVVSVLISNTRTRLLYNE